jgi:uncharacterized membrane protein YccC
MQGRSSAVGLLQQLKVWWREVTRLVPVRPAFLTGLRAATAIVVPLLLIGPLNLPALSWTSVAAFAVSLADKGGAYRTRLNAMGIAALGCIGLAFAGALCGRSPYLALPFTVLSLFAANLLRIYGAAKATAGGSMTIVALVSLATPATTIEEALLRAGLVAAGAGWSMTLSLMVWPILPYGPARTAIAAVYAHLSSLFAGLAQGRGARVSAEAQHIHGQVRLAIEEARGILAATRRGRLGESKRGERLLVLLELADQLFAAAVPLSGLMSVLEAEQRAALQPRLSALADGLQHSAEAIPRDEPSRFEPATLAAEPVQPELDRLLQRIEGLHLQAHRALRGIGTDTPATSATALLELTAPHHPLEMLRAHFTFESVIFRHALRVAITGGAALVVTYLLQQPRGYWITLTAVLVLQPYLGATFYRAFQRVVGTVLGGAIAALVASASHERYAVVAVVFAFATISLAVLPINYGLFSVFATPTFVLLAELGADDWNLAPVRILNTAIGGLIGLLGARLLFPLHERALLPKEIAHALRESAALVHGAAQPSAARAGALRVARSRAGLAITNAEASFQRLIAESMGDATLFEPAMSVLVGVRRFNAAVLALTEDGLRPTLEGAPWTEAVQQRLQEEAAALAGGDPLPAALELIGAPERMVETTQALLVALERLHGTLRQTQR